MHDGTEMGLISLLTEESVEDLEDLELIMKQHTNLLNTIDVLVKEATNKQAARLRAKDMHAEALTALDAAKKVEISAQIILERLMVKKQLGLMVARDAAKMGDYAIEKDNVVILARQELLTNLEMVEVAKAAVSKTALEERKAEMALKEAVGAIGKAEEEHGETLIKLETAKTLSEIAELTKQKQKFVAED